MSRKRRTQNREINMSRKFHDEASRPRFLPFSTAEPVATSIMVIKNLCKVSVRKGSSFCDRGRLDISRDLRDARLYLAGGRQSSYGTLIIN